MKNRAIIVGGGASIRQNLWKVPICKLPVWANIKDEFTIGTNWAFKYFDPTILMYSDYQFYATEKENMKNIPLILGKQDGAYNREDGVKLEDNTLLLKECETKTYLKYGELKEGLHPYYWGKDAWSKGWFTSQLIGIKALNLAIAMDYDEIFLLGFDATDINGHTHFYDDTSTGHYTWNNQTHSGVGKDDRGYYRTGNYNKIEELNNYWFAPFKQEINNGISIYNVSLNSKIDTFPKIRYDTFFKMIENSSMVNHEEIRNSLRRKLNEQKT